MTDAAPSAAPSLLDPRLQAIMADPAPPADDCLDVARQLFRAGRLAEGEPLTAKAVAIHPTAKDLWNIHGVFLRMLRRPADCLAAFDRALHLDPDFAGALTNRGNVHLDQGDPQSALADFGRLLSRDPQGPAPQVMISRALLRLNRADEAVVHLRSAVRTRPDYVDAWQILASALNDLSRPEEAEAVLDEALRANPGQLKLLEAKALLLRLSGRRRDAESFLRHLLPSYPAVAWIHFHLGDLLAISVPEQAVVHLRQALTLEPGQADHALALLKALGGSVAGDEGSRLDEAYEISRRIALDASLKPAHSVLLHALFARACAFGDLDALGSFEALGRSWANAGLNAPLMYQLSRADTPEKARELVSQHRIWGRAIEARAAQSPIVPPSPRTDGRIRLGVMSSDLRDHPVGRFALPLFEHVDRERFEVFAYTFNRGAADPVQAQFEAQADHFRWWPEVSAREAAQRIAEDSLDMLIELGGATDMNMPEVLAYRPAARQASWLGYPHSTGLSTVDDYICDAHNAPLSAGLLVEAPLLMPKSWIAMSETFAARLPPVRVEIPEDRQGRLTYGTANNPYKYTPEVLAAWARIVAATPGAHFAFIRPEGGSRVFRRNIEAAFAAQGVTADRIDWIVTRGGHLQAYGMIDISLDTFPLTGGTTTVDSLLMGVPVVSLAGEAFFERLSHSILMNAGLGELSVETLENFQAVALELAADPGRRRALRGTLRANLAASPLGDAKAFARDFYDLIHRTVTA